MICRNSNLKKKKNCPSGTSLIGENYYVYATETDQDKKRTFAYIGHATHPIKKLSIGVVRFNLNKFVDFMAALRYTLDLHSSDQHCQRQCANA